LTLTADLLRELRLDRIPEPREAVPMPRATIRDSGEIINFRKALACVDALETAAFTRYIPDGVDVDQKISTKTFVPGWSQAFMVPTDRPVPMNEKVAAALRVNITDASTKAAYFAELGAQLGRYCSEFGVRRISPPLVFSTSGAKDDRGVKTTPLLGVIVTLDRTPADGQTQADMMNDVGVLAPIKDIKPDPEGLMAATLAYNPKK
jgi:hypothetical protein